MEVRETLGQWVEERCRKEGMSLRQAARKTGLSHGTIADIIKGNQPSSETIKKLAKAFSDDGRPRLALEDALLVLAGYRTPRPEGEDLGEPMARLLDRLSQLSEPQLELVGHFVNFITQMEVKK